MRDAAEPVRVAVLLGTGWGALEHHNTRWRSVLDLWAGDERVDALTVVDFPSMSIRNLARRRAAAAPSWHERIPLVRGRVAVLRSTSPLDALAWRMTGRALRRALGRVDVAIAATPLWAPVLRHLDATRRGFDAVDDWRALSSIQRVQTHVTAGYEAAASVNSATAVSDALSERLARDFGLPCVTVANGVDLARFADATAAPPAGLPPEPFALYVGVIEERVDIDLLARAGKVMPVVAAGPANAATAEALRAAGVTWLGPVDPSQVPALMRAAAVGLLPHRDNALTTSMDPMKAREYLAAGLPIVTSVGLPDDCASPRVALAGPDAFADAVRAAARLEKLDGPDPSVHHRSWRDVADELLRAHVG
jgi:glycosyltransferase involved in cell wall biosynthesis